MPITRAECERLPDMTGVRLACSIHLDLKMVPALEALLEHGAQVFLLTASSTTVRDGVVTYLRDLDAVTYAWQGMTEAERQEGVQHALAWEPTHTCEMGADLAAAAGERAGGSIRAGLESTGSGVDRLRGLRLRYPVFNLDDLPVKDRLHNRFMVGLSTWQAFCERTQLSLHGRDVVVVGYGSVGQGVAQAARAFGGVVSVVEQDPSRRLEAGYAGLRTGTVESLAPQANVVVTATGRPNAVTADILHRLKPGCFVLNVGHLAQEIALEALNDRREVIPFVEQCQVGGTQIYLFAGGSMANLTAGHGDSLNAFDLTLAIMVAGVGLIVDPDLDWPPGVHPLPREAWQEAAILAAERSASAAGD